MSLYTVTLMDFPDLPTSVAAEAENRFRRALDKALGEDVMLVFQAFRAAEESGEDELTKQEIALAEQWPRAYKAAMDAGFGRLGEADGAHFEVRLL
ncbi:MAG: hypothetical protein EON54_01395 [Alcaligenaceae bacterium]|nr:MAG: hypothetical protein EON54_01395 [Alcaligenaceae bacterium]